MSGPRGQPLDCRVQSSTLVLYSLERERSLRCLRPSFPRASPAPSAQTSSSIQQTRRKPTKPSRNLPKLSTQIARSPVKRWAFARFSAPEKFLSRNCPLITPIGVRSAPPPRIKSNKPERPTPPKRPQAQPRHPKNNTPETGANRDRPEQIRTPETDKNTDKTVLFCTPQNPRSPVKHRRSASNRLAEKIPPKAGPISPYQTLGRIRQGTRSWYSAHFSAPYFSAHARSSST